MQEAVNSRSGDDAHGNQYRQTGIQGIATGKDFSRRGVHRRDRPHTTENHGRVEKGIEPGELFGVMVAAYPCEKRPGNEDEGKARIPDLAADKLRAGQERFPHAFEFSRMISFAFRCSAHGEDSFLFRPVSNHCLYFYIIPSEVKLTNAPLPMMM